MKLTFVRKPGYGTSLRDSGFNTVKDNSRKARNHFDIAWYWGSNTLVNAESGINPPFIPKSKLQDLATLDSSGIRVPNFQIRLEDTDFSNDQVWLGRKKYHHGGADILSFHTFGFYLNYHKDFEYFSRYIPKEREFRIYVLFNRVIAVDEKIPQNRNDVAWNHSLNPENKFTNLRWDHWPKIGCLTAIKATEALDRDFLAVDLIYYDKHYYVLEGNTAPSITGEYKLGVLRKVVNWIEKTAEISDNWNFNVPELVRNYRDLILPCLLGE